MACVVLDSQTNVAVQQAEIPEAGLFRGESKPDGTPTWYLAKRESEDIVQLPDDGARYLDLQYAQGNFKRNFNMADKNLLPTLRLFLATHDIREGWWNGAPAKSHQAFVLTPIPAIDAKKAEPKALLASLMRAPEAPRAESMFTGRQGRRTRIG